NPEKLVRLNAQSPTRVREAVLDRRSCVFGEVRTVHRLQEELLEVQRLQRRRIERRLRKYQLQLIAAAENPFRSGLRTHADPIDATRRRLRPVRLDGDLEADCVQGVDGIGVQLKKRL